MATAAVICIEAAQIRPRRQEQAQVQMPIHDAPVTWVNFVACRALMAVLGLGGSPEISPGSPYGGHRQASLPMALQELALIALVLWRLRFKPSQEYKMCSRKQVVAAALHATLKRADTLAKYLKRLPHIK